MISALTYPGPAFQVYLLDLCTYDSYMLLKVADSSLYHADRPHLAGFLLCAAQILAMRVRVRLSLGRNAEHRSASTQPWQNGVSRAIPFPFRLTRNCCDVSMLFAHRHQPPRSLSPWATCATLLGSASLLLSCSTERLSRVTDSTHGEVFVKRERKWARAEAELSALVRLRCANQLPSFA